MVLTMMMIQVLPVGTSCTGTCEVLLRSHDGVAVILLRLPPGDDGVYGGGDGSDDDDDGDGGESDSEHES